MTMPITVTIETGIPRSLPLEHCAFCGRRTRYWYKETDVAVCRECAETHSVREVPSKEAWCDSDQGMGRMANASVNADILYDEKQAPRRAAAFAAAFEEALTAEEAPHPGVHVREELLPSFGLTVARTTRLIAHDRASFIKVLDGKASVTRDLAYKLGALMGDDVTHRLLAMQVAHDHRQGERTRAELANRIERLARIRP